MTNACLEIRAGNTKKMLTCGVPDLQLDFLPPQLNCFDLKINSDCGDKSCVESIL